MRVQLVRFAAGAVAAGALAAVGVFVLPTGSDDWQPVTYGLAQKPEDLVPATVTEAQPARVLSTTVGADGKPVVTVAEATDKASAVKLVEKAQKAKDTVSVEIDAPVYALGVPTGSDPYRSQQWDIAKMRTVEAWQKSTGAGIKVAVIDTGVDPRHPDLAANVLSGYDATTNRAGASRDGNGHGTHVAGTIAAVTGNDVGVTGIAPDVRILPVKVLADNGSGYSSDTAEGIIWAADNGAQVINMSLGGPTKVTAVSNAVKYARSKGVTVIAAAGNERTSGSPTSYPGADEGVIAVAATDSADRFASYSNRGSYVDVAAPGSGIISTYPTALGRAYASLNGTSMASPHVAAVAALLKAYQPATTPDQIEAALERSAVDLGASGFDNDYGYGRIDAVAALAAVAPAPTTPATTAPAKAPTTAPATTAPATTAPATTAPATTAPTKAPTTAPTTGTPTITPTTSAPATSAPTTAPTTSAPVTTSPSAPKLNPLITTNVTAREVVYGSATSTTFTVRVAGKAWTGKPVEVCLAEAGAPAACTAATTTAAGTVLVPRTAKAGFQVFVKMSETGTTSAATSPAATWTARAQATVQRAGKGVLTVTVNGASGQNVQVQQYANRVWQTVLEYPAVAKATIGGATGGRQYRVVVADTTAVLGVTSTPVTA
ncbi:S8 family peptidase [Actinoplanes utahensis]|uniref:Peptidase n=1 Tax=Actinoplanes utahensis TaxID=1869 RepID=A0A0A6X325_ACTUT|nr:S8 family peptidase [Actinoplanes utahensis]KHD74517.1 peptidase [Actinoplanes utahensis]GIF28764.1 hypothetical protein Aut01nite_17500 [Actinoplanes utahensis]